MALFAWLFLSAGLCMAQQQLTVLLKKGAVLRGEMVNYEFGDTLYMVLEKSDKVLRIPDSEIRKIRFHKADYGVDFDQKKWILNTGLSFLPGSTSTGLSASQAFSYRLKGNLFTGVAVAAENYYLNDGSNVFPVLGCVKYYFSDKVASPFVDMRMGYGLSFPNERVGQALAKGGMHFNPRVGLRFGSRYLYTELHLGLKFQNLTYQYAFVDRKDDYEIVIRRLDAGISFTF